MTSSDKITWNFFKYHEARVEIDIIFNEDPEVS